MLWWLGCVPSTAPARRSVVGPPPSAMPVRTGVPGSVLQAFLSGSSASSASARRVANTCSALASRWITSSTSQGLSDVSEEPKPVVRKQPTLQQTTYGVFNPEDPDLLHPDLYFQKRPILRRLNNGLVTNPAGRSKWTVEDDTRETFFSLQDLMVVNQLDDYALGKALDEGNLLISWETGKFALKECKPFALQPERVQSDCSNLHDLIIRFVERHHGKGAKDLLPYDVQDWLKKLKAECISMKMLLFHPVFMTWLERALFRIMADVAVKMPVQYESDSCVKDKLQVIISKLPHIGPQQDQNQTLKSIVSKNRSISAWNLHRDNQKKRHDKEKKKKKRKQQQQQNKNAGDPSNSASAKPQSQPPSAAEVAFMQLVNDGCRLMGLNRDGVNHLFNLPKDLKQLVSLKAIVGMLHFEFPSYECKLLDLLEESDLWHLMEMARILKVSQKKLEAIISQDDARAELHRVQKLSDES